MICIHLLFNSEYSIYRSWNSWLTPHEQQLYQLSAYFLCLKLHTCFHLVCLSPSLNLYFAHWLVSFIIVLSPSRGLQLQHADLLQWTLRSALFSVGSDKCTVHQYNCWVDSLLDWLFLLSCVSARASYMHFVWIYPVLSPPCPQPTNVPVAWMAPFCVCVVRIPVFTRMWKARTALWSFFSFPTFTWVLGVETGHPTYVASIRVHGALLLALTLLPVGCGLHFAQ